MLKPKYSFQVSRVFEFFHVTWTMSHGPLHLQLFTIKQVLSLQSLMKRFQTVHYSKKRVLFEFCRLCTTKFDKYLIVFTVCLATFQATWGSPVYCSTITDITTTKGKDLFFVLFIYFLKLFYFLFYLFSFS